MSADIGDIFADVFDAVAPILLEIADALGFPLNLVIGFLFGGIETILTEVLF